MKPNKKYSDLDILVLGLVLGLVLDLVLGLVLVLASDNENIYFIGIIIGVILGIALISLGIIKVPQQAATYTKSFTQQIDGSSYIINATYNQSTSNCIAIDSATYFIANATGVHYIPLNNTGIRTIANYLGC